MKPNDERNATILVIDDEKAIRRMLRLSLEAHGYNVTDFTGVSLHASPKESILPVPPHSAASAWTTASPTGMLTF